MKFFAYSLFVILTLGYLFFIYQVRQENTQQENAIKPLQQKKSLPIDFQFMEIDHRIKVSIKAKKDIENFRLELNELDHLKMTKKIDPIEKKLLRKDESFEVEVEYDKGSTGRLGCYTTGFIGNSKWAKGMAYHVGSYVQKKNAKMPAQTNQYDANGKPLKVFKQSN